MSPVSLFIFMTALIASHTERDEEEETQQRDISGVLRHMNADTKKASVGMAEIHSHAVEKVDEVAERTEAERKLQAMAKERARLYKMAEDLDHKMHKQYAELMASEASKSAEKSASLLSIKDAQEGNQREEEDRMFAELEQQTKNIVNWFQELQEIRHSRDELEAQSKEKVQSAGLIQQQAETEAYEGHEADEKLGKKKQELADVMAISAVEMAQIQKAAAEVEEGVKDFAKWKENQDNSPESLAEAAKLQAKFKKAMAFLKDHEGMVEIRTNQINALMKETGLGQL
jgi:hypothetical protein